MEKVLELSWKNPGILFSCFCMNPGPDMTEKLFSGMSSRNGMFRPWVVSANFSGFVWPDFFPTLR